MSGAITFEERDGKLIATYIDVLQADLKLSSREKLQRALVDGIYFRVVGVEGAVDPVDGLEQFRQRML